MADNPEIIRATGPEQQYESQLTFLNRVAEDQGREYIANLSDQLHGSLASEIRGWQQDGKKFPSYIPTALYEAVKKDVITESNYQVAIPTFLFVVQHTKDQGIDVRVFDSLMEFLKYENSPLTVPKVDLAFAPYLEMKLEGISTDLHSLIRAFFTAPSTLKSNDIASFRSRALAFEEEARKEVIRVFQTMSFGPGPDAEKERRCLYNSLVPNCIPEVFDALLKQIAFPLVEPKSNDSSSRFEDYYKLRNLQFYVLLTLEKFLSDIATVLLHSPVDINNVKCHTSGENDKFLDLLISFRALRKGYEGDTGASALLSDTTLEHLRHAAEAFALNAAQVKGEGWWRMPGGKIEAYKAIGKTVMLGPRLYTYAFAKVGEPTLRVVLQNCDPFGDRCLLRALDQVKARFGPNAPKTIQVLKFLRQSPLSKMFREILTIHSPLTAAFFAYYLYMSPDKTRGALSLVGMLVACSTVNALSCLTYRLVRTFQWGKNVAGGETLLLRLTRASLKKPWVALAVVTLLMMVGHNKLEEQVEKINKLIPEGLAKDSAGEWAVYAFSLLAGPYAPLLNEHLWEYGAFIGRELGVGSVNPETDVQDVILEDMVGWKGRIGGGWFPYPNLERFPVNDSTGWNGLVDKAIAKEPNARLKRLYALEKINPNTMEYNWFDRQRLLLFRDVNSARQLQADLTHALGNKGAFQGDEDFLGIATKKIESGEEAQERNDKRLKVALDQSRRNGGIVYRLEHASDDVRDKWFAYQSHVSSIARRVMAIQRLHTSYTLYNPIDGQNVMANGYEEEYWIPGTDPKKNIMLLHNGLEGTIKYELAREAIFFAQENDSKEERIQLAKDLTDPTVLERDSPHGKAAKSEFLRGTFELIDWWKSLWGERDPDQLIQHMAFIRALAIAAKGAVLYTPEDNHQINAALTRLRERSLNRELFEQSIKTGEFFDLYDSITDSMCQYHAQKAMTTKGLCENYAINILNRGVTDMEKRREFFEKFTAQFGLSPDNVFFAIDCDPALKTHNHGIFLKRFLKTIKDDKPSVVLCQFTQPTYTQESVGYLSAMRLHCFHQNPRGEWWVSVHRQDYFVPRVSPPPKAQSMPEFILEQLKNPTTLLPVFGPMTREAIAHSRRREARNAALPNIRNREHQLTLQEWFAAYPGFAKDVEPRIRALQRPTERPTRPQERSFPYSSEELSR